MNTSTCSWYLDGNSICTIYILLYIGVLYHTYRQDTANVLPGVDNLCYVQMVQYAKKYAIENV